jgi:hypothetical protein
MSLNVLLRPRPSIVTTAIIVTTITTAIIFIAHGPGIISHRTVTNNDFLRRNDSSGDDNIIETVEVSLYGQALSFYVGTNRSYQLFPNTIAHFNSHEHYWD